MSRSRRPRPNCLKNDREFERVFSGKQKRAATKAIRSGDVEQVAVVVQKRPCEGWAH